MSSMQGKVALVTGGGSGIGRATADTRANEPRRHLGARTLGLLCRVMRAPSPVRSTRPFCNAPGGGSILGAGLGVTLVAPPHGKEQSSCRTDSVHPVSTMPGSFWW